MVCSNGQRGVVSEQADDVEVGHAGLDHHDVGSFSLVQAGLPQGFPVVGGVLLVGLLVGRDDSPFLACRIAFVALLMMALVFLSGEMACYSSSQSPSSSPLAK